MENNVEILELIRKRYSPRIFSHKKIEEKEVTKLFEAARWAASSYNEQPWRFIYAVKENRILYDQLFHCLNELNKQWVKSAPLIILTLIKKNFTHNNKPNKHARHDLGLAVGNMTIQGMSMGIFLHSMGGFSTERAIDSFNIPEEYEPATMIALGYPGEINDLPENLKKIELKERKRKSIKEIAFKGPIYL